MDATISMHPDAYVEMAENEAQHWWFRARREILSDFIAQMGLAGDAQILEAGCGTGGNLSMLATHGTLSAFEMDDYARGIAIARSPADCQILPGRCPDQIPFPNRRFDLICMLDVLEHIAEDGATLRAFRTMLDPAGKLLLTVPAHPWLYGPHDASLHHERRYTKDALQRLVVDSGYCVHRLSYFNFALFPIVAAMRVVEKAVPGKIQGHGSRTPQPWVNQLLYRVFRAERRWLPTHDIPQGVSLLCVAGPRHGR